MTRIDNLINLLEASFMIWLSYGYWVLHKRVCELENSKTKETYSIKKQDTCSGWRECFHTLKELSPGVLGGHIRLISCSQHDLCPLKSKRKAGRPRKDNK